MRADCKSARTGADRLFLLLLLGSVEFLFYGGYGAYGETRQLSIPFWRIANPLERPRTEAFSFGSLAP